MHHTALKNGSGRSTDQQKHEALLKCYFDPLPAGVAYIRLFIF